MDTVDNTGVMTDTEENKGETNTKGENKDETNADKSQPNGTPSPEKTTPSKATQSPNDMTDKEKKRTHRKYIPSINLTALKELEGTTTSSFLDLARAVILIDNVPYDETSLPMSKARKIDFERLVAHHAQLVIYGTRKYYIKSVINRKAKEELNDVELKVIRERPYIELSKEEKEKRRKKYQESKSKTNPKE